MKKFLAYIFAIALLIPTLQFLFKPISPVSLFRVEINRKRPTFDWQQFLDGAFQQNLERWLVQNSGFFGRFTKLNNTINYHLFKVGSSNYKDDTLVGRDYALFDRIYINDLNGKYISSTDNIQAEVRILAKLQNYLESKGKTFLLVIHPNKAVSNPDWISFDFKSLAPEKRYIDRIQPWLDQYGIKYLKVGDQLKPGTQYYVKSGAHFNDLGKCLSAKLVSERLANNSKFDWPKFDCNITGEQAPYEEDLDLANLLNTWNVSRSIEPVPTLDLKIHSTTDNKISIAFYGTSYLFGMLSIFDRVKAFDTVDFMFYSATHYYSRNKKGPKPKYGKKSFQASLQSLKFLERHDIVVLESTEARLHQLGFGLLEKLKSELQ
jgi:hypothetical protein